MEANSEQPEKPTEQFATFDEHKTLLTERQKLFCLEFVQTGVAVTAYKKVYGERNKKGALRSGDCLRQMASTLLKQAKIQNEIKALQETLRNSATVAAADVARANIHAGFLDISSFFTVDKSGAPRVLLPSELPPEVRGCVREFTVEQEEIKPRKSDKNLKHDDVLHCIVKITYKVTDQQKARDALAKQMGWDKPVKPLEKILEHLSPELRARVWAELKPIIESAGS